MWGGPWSWCLLLPLRFSSALSACFTGWYSPLLSFTATSQVFQSHLWKSSLAHYFWFCFIRARFSFLIFFVHGFIAAVFVQGQSFQVLMTLFRIMTQQLNISIRVMNVVAEDYWRFLSFPQVVCFLVEALQQLETPTDLSSLWAVVVNSTATFSIVAVGPTSYFSLLALESNPWIIEQSAMLISIVFKTLQFSTLSQHFIHCSFYIFTPFEDRAAAVGPILLVWHNFTSLEFGFSIIQFPEPFHCPIMLELCCWSLREETPIYPGCLQHTHSTLISLFSAFPVANPRSSSALLHRFFPAFLSPLQA